MVVRTKLMRISGEPARLAEEIYQQSKRMGRAISMEHAYQKAVKQLDKQNNRLPSDWGFKL